MATWEGGCAPDVPGCAVSGAGRRVHLWLRGRVEDYWGKSAKELSLAEAATLAGILPAPARWLMWHPSWPSFGEIGWRRMELMGYDVDCAC